MGQKLYELISDWAEGVVTTIEADDLKPNASPYGRNSHLFGAGAGKAIVQKRRGCSTMNRTAITGSPVVLGQYNFQRLSSGSFTGYHMLVSDNGRLDTIDASGNLTNISTSAVTAGTYFLDFATANNLAFFVNGQDRKKFNGTTVQNFGITAPATAPTLTDSGVAGNHNGTYEARVTFVNSVTGHESSAGSTSATVTVANKQLSWSAIPVSSDTQVDTRKLYLRNTSTQSEFFLAATISDNSSTTATTNLVDASLITLGPDTEENNPPPTSVKYLAWNHSRLFAATDTAVYYSQVGLPEAFDPDNFEVVGEDDGQKITGLHAAQEVLIVFKTAAMYVIDGTNPQTWTIRLIDGNIGCTSHKSILTVEGFTYWWSEQGPMIWDGASPPRPIGTTLIRDTVSGDNINYARLDQIQGIADLTHEHIIWAVPEASQTRNTMLLPYNYRLQRWESDRWDPMDVASLVVVDDSTGQPWVFLGGYAGQIFKWWNADNDGIASGTHTGAFVATGTSQTVFTDASAAFDTTGAGLIERKVTIVDSSGDQVGSLRPRISANTATTFTVATAVTGLTIGETYTYIVGGPDFEWHTGWQASTYPYHKKRYEYLFVQCKSTSSATRITIDLATDYNSMAAKTYALTFSSNVPAAIWDTSLWDDDDFGTQTSVTKRNRVGKTGQVWQARVRNRNCDEPVTLQKVAMQSELLTTNLG